LEKDFKDQGVTIRKTDIVGPKAGKDLRTSALKALFYAMIFIMVYIGLRFDFRYAPGVAVSLIHDATFVLGFWVLTQIEFTLQIVAALLAIIGYSVNDTVVIYDRVREHEHKNPELPLDEILDNAINETLSRTILTAGATFLVCLAMFLWGGDSIRDFFLAMCVGILIGTYSSIFVATPLTLYIDRLKRKVS
jgi:preprotein translocase subunit SecF